MQSPYALFDPTQWSNQFSNYNNQALPWPSQYVGTPSNAMGQPIQPPMGTTLNSQPAAAAPAAAAQSSSSPFANVQIPRGQNTALAQPFGGLDKSQWDALTPQQRGPAQAAMQNYQAGLSMAPSDPFVASHNNPSGFNPQSAGAGAMMANGINGWNQMLSQPQAAAPPAAAPQGQNTMGLNSALSMLANPGHVDTPGATVPQSSAYQPQNSVLQQFLQNWQPAQSGPGSGFQQGFARALGQ
jgi:hypothetical protein